MTLCFVCLPTSQGMQWGQRSFEIDFKVLVIFVDVWFKTRLAFEKEHLIGVRKKSVGGPRCLSGVHWIYQGPPKVCRGPNKGPSGVLWDPLGGILGSIRASLGGLLVTKFGELIWTALQFETRCHHPINFIYCFGVWCKSVRNQTPRVCWDSVRSLPGLFLEADSN